MSLRLVLDKLEHYLVFERVLRRAQDNISRVEKLLDLACQRLSRKAMAGRQTMTDRWQAGLP